MSFIISILFILQTSWQDCSAHSVSAILVLIITQNTELTGVEKFINSGRASARPTPCLCRRVYEQCEFQFIKHSEQHSTKLVEQEPSVVGPTISRKNSIPKRPVQCKSIKSIHKQAPLAESLTLEMKTCPTAKQLANFEHDAITAVMSFAVNSGFGRFLGSEKLHSVCVDMKEESFDISIIPEASQPLVQEIAIFRIVLSTQQFFFYHFLLPLKLVILIIR